jgi:four helix bundle protein
VKLLDHEKLEVYQLAVDFVRIVGEILRRVPRGNGELVQQLKKASLSLMNNIAEGAGRTTRAEKRRFYSFARGSALECGASIDYIIALKLVSGSLPYDAKQLLVRVTAMLSALSKNPTPTPF